MVDINHNDIKLMASQRLDDTNEGGGQMTSTEVIDGNVNNLFPDISRLDRVAGRVSMRKAYLAVQTANRATYYGSHGIITEQAKDPNVKVVMFSTKDWFDTREDAKNRIEAYMVQGPQYQAALWGNHYEGSRQLVIHSDEKTPAPAIGDVLVLVKNQGLSAELKQFLRITDVESEVRSFVYSDGTPYNKLVVTLSMGGKLVADFLGVEVFRGSAYTNSGTNNIQTVIYTTVAADTSKYYGVAKLQTAAQADDLQLKVDSIFTQLVPSAQSETAIVNAGIGRTTSPMLQTQPSGSRVPITRSVAYQFASGGSLIVGEGVLPGTLTWVGGGIQFDDNGKSDIIDGLANVIGSIDYPTGVISFGAGLTGSYSGAGGTLTYVPACAPADVSDTGMELITAANRGFVYTFICDPLPIPGSVRVEYLAGGKWYTLRDLGLGEIKGSDPALGSGTVNFTTGTISVSLGYMPDIDSAVMYFWKKSSLSFDMSGVSVPLLYPFALRNTGVNKNTVIISWIGDGNGPGPDGRYATMDDGAGKMTAATYSGGAWHASAAISGWINYALGTGEFKVGSIQYVPRSTEEFTFSYSYGTQVEEIFPNPAKNGGLLQLTLQNAIVPKTLQISYKNKWENYDVKTVGLVLSKYKKYNLDKDYNPGITDVYQQSGEIGIMDWDDGSGGLDITNGTVNYATGAISFNPDVTATIPMTVYEWQNDIYTDQTITTWQFNGPPIESKIPVMTDSNYLPSGFQNKTATTLYMPTAVSVKYIQADGANSALYTETLLKEYDVLDGSGLYLIPGSIRLIVPLYTGGSKHVTDNPNGKLYRDISGVTGAGVEVGSVDYSTRRIRISDDTLAGRTITVTHASGRHPEKPVQKLSFRTPGAPIRVGSLQIRATLPDGTTVDGVSNSYGWIVGDGVHGGIDYETGIGNVIFGAIVPDDTAAQAEPWYSGAPKDTTNHTVLRPYTVDPATILMNCVAITYLPLDETLLGLNPVRLPVDGKVPIFRDGDIVVVHHPQQMTLPNPVVAGATYTLPRQNLSMIELYDATGKYVYDLDTYTVDLDAGTVTMASPLTLTGYTQPLVAIHRIEDMGLCSDVQVTGHIALANPLVHSYPAGTTMVSSVLPSQDLQSRVHNEFTQVSWTNVWSDDRIGSAPVANYDLLNFPIEVANASAPKERFAIIFTGTTTVQVVGEHLGSIGAGPGNPSSVITSDIAPLNPITGAPYFTIRSGGWGSGWAAGNVLRFNCEAANFPYWFIRTTLQGPPTEPTDHYRIQLRGDTA